MKKLLIPVFVLATLGLSGCTTTYPQVALDPSAPQINQRHTGQLSFSSQDLRSANYIAKIKKSDDAAQLIAPTQPPRLQIQQLLSDAFAKQGYRIQAQAPVNVQLNLVDLKSVVEQKFYKYQANTNIELTLVADNGNQTLTKTYRGNAQRSAPLSADPATLELEINQLITKVLQEIVDDPELHSFIAN
ncbi:YajG family lipoprotein [Paraferrimonas haliotis]|uniref:Lipoprotein n=1 Tax=Paraferrimonas haliotis TaxID=2013866 RepID=A0AA37WVM7_9GAMM|nr:YajG family lipoprotein [Paraferrimonas haliotis]GLS82773.1 hypothetical protein GCM10007894_07500 [Paraferrimonas haliotis]